MLAAKETPLPPDKSQEETEKKKGPTVVGDVWAAREKREAVKSRRKLHQIAIRT